ncbi:MAG: hypothetical protein ACE5F1_05645 [Planctomycetota bacterium]
MTVLPRLATAKSRLNIAWTAASPRGEEQLDFQSSLREIRGRDTRPLLIVRDCSGCSKKVDDLLERTLENERFQLASQWFHCVKLPRSVIRESHPFHALFGPKNPPHMILSSWNGSKVKRLLGTTYQRVFWRTVASVLRTDYKKNPTKAVKELLGILNQFDQLDAQAKELRAQIASGKKKNKKARVKKLEAKLARAQKLRDETLKREKKLRDLVLKRQADKATLPSGRVSLSDRFR